MTQDTQMTANETLLKEGLTETYMDVRNLLFDCAHRYEKIFPIPFDEIVSIGHELFMYCAERYKPGRNAHFSTYFRFVLDRQFTTRLEKEVHLRTYSEVDDRVMGYEEVHDMFLTDFKERLSQDANYIIALVFDTPDELSVEFKWNNVNTSGKYIRQMTHYLTELGWDRDRIEWALAEIQRRLGHK